MAQRKLAEEGRKRLDLEYALKVCMNVRSNPDDPRSLPRSLRVWVLKKAGLAGKAGTVP